MPIKSWLPIDEIEPGAMEQLQNAAHHPYVGSHVAVMPDCHQGYGVTIGSIVPTVDVVVPNAVGVDIGCGVAAVETGIALDPERMGRAYWQRWAGQVARDVPTGFAWHDTDQGLGPLDRALKATSLQSLVRDRAAKQLGTLGGGNHFMEAQVDERGVIWLMVHSGSRNLGLRIAGYYHEQAQQVTDSYSERVTKDLDVLHLDSKVGQHYLHDMQWAIEYAHESRRRMLQAMLNALSQLEKTYLHDRPAWDVPHNLATAEIHDGMEVMVHRKGATSASSGQLGLIPGSMGTPSYVVEGRGNPDSFMSCSHGAGRRMGRRAAKREITEEQFVASLEGTYSKPSMTYVDEAPGAYKDIEVVIGRQRDLVDIVHTLRPLITVKGDSRAKED